MCFENLGEAGVPAVPQDMAEGQGLASWMADITSKLDSQGVVFKIVS